MESILKRSSMQAVVEELKPQGSHIGDQFFPMVEEGAEETIWDVLKPGEGLASIRAVDAEAKIMQGKAFDRRMATITDMAAKRRLNVSDVRALREAGELPVENATTLVGQLAARARRRITTELARMRTVVENRLEWARIEALQGGISYQDVEKNILIELDYGVPGSQKDVTPSVDWDTTATSNPIDDLQTWMDTVAEATGVEPGMIIVTRKALSYVAQSESIRGYFQYTNPVLTAQDAEKIFNERLGIKVVQYNARYEDDNGNWTRFMPENRLIMLPDMGVMTGTKRFADTAYTPHPHNNYRGDFYVWQDEKKDPWGIEVGVGLTALPRIYQPTVILTANLW